MPRKPSASAVELMPEAPAVKKIVRRRKPSPSMSSSQSLTPQSEPRRQEEKSSSGAIIIILAVLVLVVLGGYVAYNYFQNKAAEEAAIQEAAATEAAAVTATTTPEAPVDPTANWLVYNSPVVASSSASSSISLSFKYPAELQLTNNSDNLILSSASVSSTQVNISWVKSKKSLTDYLTAMDKLNAKAWEGKPSVTIATSTDAIAISGLPAVFRQQKLLAAGLNQYITYVKASDTVYAIGLAAPQLDQNLLAFFVTFLNNFKFGQ